MLVLALIATAACSSSSKSQASKATTTIPATTTTTDPYAIPATIDVAYVQRVMDALDVLSGNAAKALLRDKMLSPDFEKYVNALSTVQSAETTRKVAQLEIGLNFRDYQPSPGQPVTTVKSVLVGRANCVFFLARRDTTTVERVPTPVSDKYIELRLLDASRDPIRLNKTPWVIAQVGDITHSRGADLPCAGS